MRRKRTISIDYYPRRHFQIDHRLRGSKEHRDLRRRRPRRHRRANGSTLCLQ